MQEVAECVSGKKGAPRGPQATQGIVILPNGLSCTSPKEKKKNKRGEDDDDNEGASQTKGGTGLFEVTLHRTVVRTEEEEVEIGETETG